MKTDAEQQMEGAFVTVRDAAVEIGRMAAVLDLALIEKAISEADLSLSVGSILDPTLYRSAAPELQKELRFLRAFRTFRVAIEELRP